MIAMFSTAGSGHAVFFLARLVGQSVRSPREGSAPVRAAATRIHRARTAGVKTLPACRLNLASATGHPGANPHACRRSVSLLRQAR